MTNVHNIQSSIIENSLVINRIGVFKSGYNMMQCYGYSDYATSAIVSCWAFIYLTSVVDVLRQAILEAN